ncbi:hypothetical protein [Streptomyces sp. NPDC001744]|uniref:hypothetical protein n=1 Tax=Streptomyces sp. NPDC001744 TaxID=3364606 RepID=UPI0036BBC8C8
MYEGTVPLEDFLNTMNRLQADFERRLGGIERAALAAPPRHARVRDGAGATPSWRVADPHLSLGLEAIWTDARRGGTARAGGAEEVFLGSRPDAFAD